MTDVDWATLFKTQGKIACKDTSKIPPEMLYEMEKKLFLVSYLVNGEIAQAQGKEEDSDGDGNDDDSGEGKDDNKISKDGNEDMDKNKGVPKTGNDMDQKLRTPTQQQIHSRNAGQRTVKGSAVEPEVNPICNQELQLMRAMEVEDLTYFESLSWDDGEGCSKDHENLVQKLSPVMNTENLEMMTNSEVSLNGMVSEVAAIDDWTTPEAPLHVTSDCKIVGNKLYSLINEESHHSKWEEFRKMAKEGVTDECSDLLKRMELKDFDEEYDLLDEAKEEEIDQDAGISLVEINLDTNMVAKLKETKKNQKRKTKWGPTERMARPRRFLEDGRTIMQKAQDLKKAQNLDGGNPHKSKSFAFESNDSLNLKAQCVHIKFGNDALDSNKIIDNLKIRKIEYICFY